MKKLPKILLQTTLLSICSILSATTQGQSLEEISRDQISFGAVAPDSDIKALIDTHNVRPKAGFVWMAGLSGTHRVDGDMSADEFTQSARVETISFLENAIEANNERLARFTDSYSSQDVSSDETLETQARSLLNIRSQLEEALTVAASDGPIIYGLEVEGDQAALSRVRSDNRVTASMALSLANTLIVDKAGLKPEAYKQEYRNISLLAADPEDLHSMMLNKINDVSR